VSKSSVSLLVELFSDGSTPLTLPMIIRQFRFENVEKPDQPTIKKVIFLDKPLRQRTYTKRELNTKYSQRAFRSLLLTTTGGKRETTSTSFHSSSLPDKLDFALTEISKRPVKPTPTDAARAVSDDNDDDDDDDDEGAMVISTGMDAFEWCRCERVLSVCRDHVSRR
jgi:hypothetical protein